MKCPVCLQPDLVMSDRQGGEIDYCPQCRGVWLDRGELDKIIERANQYEATQQSPSRRDEPRRDVDEKHGYKKHKPWWTEIFD